MMTKNRSDFSGLGDFFVVINSANFLYQVTKNLIACEMVKCYNPSIGGRILGNLSSLRPYEVTFGDDYL